jgi:hypothetical protein
MMQMGRAKLLITSMVTALAAGAASASSASAISFEWHVNGSLLAAGLNRTFDIGTDGRNAIIKGSPSGVVSELLSSGVSVEDGAKIFGGSPGTGEETVVFSGVTVDKPKECAVVGGKVQTVPLTTEIVESSNGTTGTGEVYILFTPKTPTTFAVFTFTNKSATETGCAANGLKAAVTGSVLGLVLPQRAEATLGALDFEPASKKYRNIKGENKETRLEFGGAAATVSGLSLVLLTSKEQCGAF